MHHRVPFDYCKASPSSSLLPVLRSWCSAPAPALACLLPSFHQSPLSLSLSIKPPPSSTPSACNHLPSQSSNRFELKSSTSLSIRLALHRPILFPLSNHHLSHRRSHLPFPFKSSSEVLKQSRLYYRDVDTFLSPTFNTKTKSKRYDARLFQAPESVPHPRNSFPARRSCRHTVVFRGSSFAREMSFLNVYLN